MIKITHIKITVSGCTPVSSNDISGADEYLRQFANGRRYEYEITWADGTSHYSRSKEPSVSQALAAWIDNFTNGPASATADGRKAYLELVRAKSPGIIEHLGRLTADLEHS